jgi:hypothetical protein
MKQELTKQEYERLDKYLRQCGYDRENCKIFWDPKVGFGIYRAFSDSIGINFSHKHAGIKLVTPNVVHELTHRIQRKRAKCLILYWFGLTLLRPWFEKEAVSAEKEASMILEIDFVNH